GDLALVAEEEPDAGEHTLQLLPVDLLAHEDLAADDAAIDVDQGFQAAGRAGHVLSSLAAVLPRVPLTIAPGRPARQRAHGAAGSADLTPDRFGQILWRPRPARARSALRYSRVTPREALS